MNRNRTMLCVLFLIISCLFISSLFAEVGDEQWNKRIKEQIEQHEKEAEKRRHPKVDGILTALEDFYKKGAEEAAKKFAAGEVLKKEDGTVITNQEDAYKKGGEDAAKEFATKRGLKIRGGGKVYVRIFLEPGVSPETFDKALRFYDGRIIKSGEGNDVSAEIPVDKIRKIADEVGGIGFITIFGGIKTSGIRSEGLSKVGFSNYSAAGITGSGVKIAVIDAGFKGLSNAISNSDLPENIIKVDCTGSCHSEQGEES